MAKSKKSPKKPSVKVQDLEPEADPKGGAGFLKISAAADKFSPSALKIDSSLNVAHKLGTTSLKPHK